jgi:uncharacterized protein with FMN-binding domain
MRRAILTLGGTVAAVAALLSFKTHSAADVTAAGPSGTSGSTSSTSSSPASAAGTGSSDKASGTKSASGRTVTGKVADTPYGPMQVQLVLTGKRISQVNVLQRTDTGEISVQIDDNSIPKLTSEVLTAQSARIDAVSGATATCQGYIQSLQSAIDAGRA